MFVLGKRSKMMPENGPERWDVGSHLLPENVIHNSYIDTNQVPGFHGESNM
jgi:hypothetical protein